MIAQAASNTEQLWVIIVGGLAVGGLSWLATAIFKLVKKLAHDVHGVTEAMITPPPTPFEPDPPKGLIEVVRTHDKTLNSLDRTVGVLLTGTRSLLESKDGTSGTAAPNTSHDEVVRLIDAEQTRRIKDKGNL